MKKKKYDLSIILPGLNPELWMSLYEDFKGSAGKCTFEVVAVGPRKPSQEFLNLENVTYVQDFGHPSRCVQRGTTLATGKYVTHALEDGKWAPNGYENCIGLLERKLNYNDGICVRFDEKDVNPNASRPLQPPKWPNVMSAHYHRDLQLPGISKDWYWHGCWMYNLEFFKEIGGLDCRFEHINLNCSDLAFRVQANGGRVIPSRDFVIYLDNKSAATPGQTPVESAFHENDNPLFKQIYIDPDAALKRFKIEYNNWMSESEVWERRWGNVSLSEAIKRLDK